MKRTCLFILVLCRLAADAQTDTTVVRRPDVLRGLDAMGYTFSAPVRWKGKDWLKLGGVVAGTAALTLLDEPIKEFLEGKDNRFLDGVERVGYHYGKPYSAAGITGGFYLVGLVFKNEWARETGLILASSLSTSNLLAAGFKKAVGRARPITGLDAYDFEPFAKSPSHHSMPSGHATVAFTISIVLARQVESIPLKIIFYSLGGITAASRMYMDAHWFSDVGFGGTIAWFCADAAIKRLKENKWRPVVRDKMFAMKLYPYPGGLSLRAQF